MIVIDGTPAIERRFGIGHYVAQLMAALADENNVRALYRCVRRHGKTFPDRPVASFLRMPHRLTELLFGRMNLSGEIALMLAGLSSRNVFVFHATTGFLPLFRRVRTVLTVYDLAFRVDPTWFVEPTSEYDRRLRASLARADHVVTISESTRQDLLKFYDYDPARVTAVPLGVAPPDPAVSGKLPGKVTQPYILAVGTLEPRKNHLRTISAFERLDTPHHLVIVGARGWKDEPILEAIERSPRRDRIHRLDYVDDATRDALYRSADMLVYPSLYEGFGLPIFEAMARGCPVVTSSISSMPEVGGDAALYVDPNSTEELTAAMERIFDDQPLRTRLLTAGRARAAEFTWKRTAKGTLDVYAKIEAY